MGIRLVLAGLCALALARRSGSREHRGQTVLHAAHEDHWASGAADVPYDNFPHRIAVAGDKGEERVIALVDSKVLHLRKDFTFTLTDHGKVVTKGYFNGSTGAQVYDHIVLNPKNAETSVPKAPAHFAKEGERAVFGMKHRSRGKAEFTIHYRDGPSDFEPSKHVKLSMEQWDYDHVARAFCELNFFHKPFDMSKVHPKKPAPPPRKSKFEPPRKAGDITGPPPPSGKGGKGAAAHPPPPPPPPPPGHKFAAVSERVAEAATADDVLASAKALAQRASSVADAPVHGRDSGYGRGLRLVSGDIPGMDEVLSAPVLIETGVSAVARAQALRGSSLSSAGADAASLASAGGHGAVDVDALAVDALYEADLLAADETASADADADAGAFAFADTDAHAEGGADAGIDEGSLSGAGDQSGMDEGADAYAYAMGQMEGEGASEDGSYALADADAEEVAHADAASRARAARLAYLAAQVEQAAQADALALEDGSMDLESALDAEADRILQAAAREHALARSHAISLGKHASADEEAESAETAADAAADAQAASRREAVALARARFAAADRVRAISQAAAEVDAQAEQEARTADGALRSAVEGLTIDTDADAGEDASEEGHLDEDASARLADAHLEDAMRDLEANPPPSAATAAAAGALSSASKAAGLASKVGGLASKVTGLASKASQAVSGAAKSAGAALKKGVAAVAKGAKAAAAAIKKAVGGASSAASTTRDRASENWGHTHCGDLLTLEHIILRIWAQEAANHGAGCSGQAADAGDAVVVDEKGTICRLLMNHPATYKAPGPASVSHSGTGEKKGDAPFDGRSWYGIDLPWAVGVKYDNTSTVDQNIVLLPIHTPVPEKQVAPFHRVFTSLRFACYTAKPGGQSKAGSSSGSSSKAFAGKTSSALAGKAAAGLAGKTATGLAGKTATGLAGKSATAAASAVAKATAGKARFTTADADMDAAPTVGKRAPKERTLLALQLTDVSEDTTRILSEVARSADPIDKVLAGIKAQKSIADRSEAGSKEAWHRLFKNTTATLLAIDAKAFNDAALAGPAFRWQLHNVLAAVTAKDLPKVQEAVAIDLGVKEHAGISKWVAAQEHGYSLRSGLEMFVPAKKATAHLFHASQFSVNLGVKHGLPNATDVKPHCPMHMVGGGPSDYTYPIEIPFHLPTAPKPAAASGQHSASGSSKSATTLH